MHRCQAQSHQILIHEDLHILHSLVPLYYWLDDPKYDGTDPPHSKNYQYHTKVHFLHVELDPRSKNQEEVHVYTNIHQCRQVYDSIFIDCIDTVLNLIQIAYLLISTLTGAPWPDPKFIRVWMKRGWQIFLTLFNI